MGVRKLRATVKSTSCEVNDYAPAITLAAIILFAYIDDLK